jgi:hypothetical protein
VRVGLATRLRLGLPWWLAVSLFLHVVVLPAHLLHGMIGQILLHKSDAELEDHATIIPIELEEEENPSAGLPPADEFEEPAETNKPRGGGADAGADGATAQDAGGDALDAEAGAADAEADDAAPDSGRLASDAAAKKPPREAGTPEDAGLPDVLDAAADAQVFAPIADPVALAGPAAKVTDTPNVAAFIYSERIRRHPLAAHFSPTLTKHPQWNSFFQGTSLDPVQDLDRIWLAGPQFRDTSRVAAVLRYRVPEAKVRAAVAAVVQRSGDKGTWLDAGVPAAKGVADRAERIFVMPAPNMLVVVPPDGLDRALKIRSIPAQGRNELFVLYLRTPRNALVGLPVAVPESLENLRFSIESASDGGVNLRLDVRDKDAANIAEHARKLTEDVENFAFVSVALFGRVRLFDAITFVAQGDHIRGETHMNERQLRTALSAMAAWIETVTQPHPAPAASHP